MPWFVLRASIGHRPRILIHDEAYPSKEAAERVAWDNSRIKNKPKAYEPIDEEVPPFIVEASSGIEAIRKFIEYWSKWEKQTGG